MTLESSNAGTFRRMVTAQNSQILIAMVAGGIVGMLFGPQTEFLGNFGKAVIQLIKALAVPLLFFSILDTFVTTHIRLRPGIKMVGIALINAVIALLIGTLLSRAIQPGVGFPMPGDIPQSSAPPQISFGGSLLQYLPSSFVGPFVENALIPIIILAVLVGLAIRREVEEKGLVVSVGPYLNLAVNVFQRGLKWVITLLPLAVFGVVAKTVGSQGLSMIPSLAKYLGVALLGLALQITVVYSFWLHFVAKVSLVDFVKKGASAFVYVLGCGSSLATLPVTLQVLDEMKCSKESARLAACVGTNLNNDGILLYEAMAVIFLAQIYGVHLSVGDQLQVGLYCALAGFGIAGVPEAGLVSLAVVASSVGLPTELLPILLTVDWIVGRARALTNVWSDLTVAMVLNRKH